MLSRKADLANTLLISLLFGVLGSLAAIAGVIASPYWEWVYIITSQRIGVLLFVAASCVLVSQVVGLIWWAGSIAADTAFRRLPRVVLMLMTLGVCVIWIRGVYLASPPQPHLRPDVLLVMLIGLLLTALLARGERPWQVADVAAMNLVALGLIAAAGTALVGGIAGLSAARSIYASWIVGYLLVALACGLRRRWRLLDREPSSLRRSSLLYRLAAVALIAAVIFYPAYELARFGSVLPRSNSSDAHRQPRRSVVSVPPEQPQLNVVLISIDTLRADRLGLYGYARNTSPNIDRFFSSGAIFTNMYAQSPWTLPSHMTLITGQYPSTHGSRLHPRSGSRYFVDALPDSAVTLAELFAEWGYRTAGFTGGAYLRPIFGFDQGFETYAVSESRRMKEALDKGLRWIDATHDRPFFLMLHSYDVHSYRPPRYFLDIEEPDYEGRLKELPRIGNDSIEGMVNRQALGRLGRTEIEYLEFLYDSEIRIVDEELQRLFSTLEDLELLERTVVVLTSDHGEAFAEHGSDTGHANSPYETVARVPLLVRAPGLESAGRIDGLAQLIDVAPTVLDLVGAPPAPSMQGVSLVSRLGAPAGERFVILEADDRDTQAAIVFEDFKYIDPGVVSHDPLDPVFLKLMILGMRSRRLGEAALYDLRRDPGEQENLIHREPGRARAYRELLYSNLHLLREWEGLEGSEARPAPPELIEQLRALGYLE